jgi:hypothetical protein
MNKKTNSSVPSNGADRWKASACHNRFRVALLSVAALFGAGITVQAANILVDPGFEATPIFSYWSAQTLESWSMNAATTTPNGLVRTGANALWMQGLYENGPAPAYYNMGAYQKIACAPGATFTADAWYSAYVSYPYAGIDGANGNSGLLTSDGSGVEDCWVEVQFLNSANAILADYKSVILSPITATQPGSAGVQTFNVTSATVPTVTETNGNVYLAWIDCQVTNQYDVKTIGPDTDPATESVTNTLSNGIMTAPPGTAFVIYFVGLAQAAYESGANFWDDCTLIQLGGPSPSVISGLTPNGSQFFNTNTSLTFSVTSASTGGSPLPTNPTNGITVLVNGVNQAANLQFTGTSTAWNISLPNLAANSLYNVIITVDNSAGLITTTTANFDTFQPVFIVPVETYDYNGGQFIQNPVPTTTPAPNSYFGLAGTLGTDMSTYAGTGVLPGGASTLIPNYPDRTDANVAFQNSGDIPLPLYLAAEATNSGVYNVNIGYNDAGNWFNYTRNPYPAGNYEVFARISGGQGAASEYLNILTGGYGTDDQTTNRLGEFDIPNVNLYDSPQGTDWTHYYWVPLTDADGNLVPVNVPSGRQTLQLLSAPIAGENVISFLFVPFPSAGLPPSISNINPANGAVFSAAAAGLTFTATASAGSTLNNSGIHLSLNGADVTSSLTLSGSGPINASYSPLRTNTIYTAVVSATNTAGVGVTRTVTFDTFSEPGNFYVKMEDWDFNGGLYDTSGNGLAPNAYEGDRLPDDTEGAVTNIDYSHSATSGNFLYRGPTGLATEVTSDTPLPGYTAGADWDVGNFNTGDWANYTRNYPAGKYYLEARLAGYAGNVTISQVTAGQGTANQTLKTLGVCNCNAANEGWQIWNWCPLLTNGFPAVVTLGGVETLRVTSGGNVNANYIMLVPVQAIKISAVQSGGKAVLTFPTTIGSSYRVWEASTLNGTWTLLQTVAGTGSTTTVSVPPGGSQGYIKITSP